MVMRMDKSLLVDVGAVIGGAFADMLVAYASSFAGGNLNPDPAGFPIYVSDIAGDAFGAGVLVAGFALKKPRIVLFGAGGLGYSLVNMTNRAIRFVPLGAARVGLPTQAPSQASRFAIAPARKGAYR
jgi:hypothetical protein